MFSLVTLNRPQQQQNHPIIGSSISTNPLLLQPPSHQQQQLHHQPPPPPPPQPHGGSSIRPGSMAERARLANIPMPEQALKCPRCESTNTKFCYFNNYSLSQPRHFCKTCRRYWTRGGALRSVPVGGGCRRNKRSKSTATSSNKSPASSSTATSSTSNMSASSGYNINTNSNMLGLTAQIPSLRFMSPLGQLTDGFSTDVGLNYGGLSTTAPPMVGSSEGNMAFHGGTMSSLLPSSGMDPWRLQQYPNFFLAGLDSTSVQGSSIYHQFQGGGGDHHQIGDFIGGETSSAGGDEIRPKVLFSPSSSMMSQLASVKMEDAIPHELNLSRQLLGGGMPASARNDQQWNGGSNAAWTELSSFSSSSTSNPL